MNAENCPPFDKIHKYGEARTPAGRRAFVSADPFFSARRKHLLALSGRHAIPTLSEFREFVEAGGSMSYGTVLHDGYYKGGITPVEFKGVNPADLPVEKVNKLELVINLKTAKTLSLDVPGKLLALADEVIEWRCYPLRCMSRLLAP